jgi:metal-sulfur cluster biosynthetic enzyme
MASTTEAASTAYPYAGPEVFRVPVFRALSRVVDPELALNIVDVGLVYGVTIADDVVRVRVTMTSPACPVTDLIIEEMEAELRKTFAGELSVEVELVWTPAWTRERLSARARRFMG